MNDATGRTAPLPDGRDDAIAAGAMPVRAAGTANGRNGGKNVGAGGMRRAVPALPTHPRPPAAREPQPADTRLELAERSPRPGPGVGDADEADAERVRDALKAKLGSEVFASWFGRLRLDGIAGPEVSMSVPTAFLRSWIVRHYASVLRDAWVEVRPGIASVDVAVRSAHRGTPAPVEDAPAPAPAPMQRSLTAPLRPATPLGAPRHDEGGSRPLGSPLDARYTLDSFVEGPANRVALAAARSIAEGGPGALAFNPLFVHASVGLGKTHLLQAIAHKALERQPQPRIVYLTAEYFMWRFAKAIQDNSALDFKEQLRAIDLLVIDDMQFLQGKSIQNEFCHLINMLLDSARQVLVAADRPPAELESLDPRVRSRLQGGIALEIAGPDYEMRRTILQRRLEEAQREDATLEIDPAILDHVATAVTGSGRELEGAFNQLLFRRSFEPDISIERVDELLAHVVRAAEPKRIRIEDIQRVVARHYNVTKHDLLSSRRTRTVVKPRQIAMYLAKTMTPRSLPEIGRRFGGRDHTTVLHAVRKIEGLTGEDNKLAQEVELLKRLINE